MIEMLPAGRRPRSRPRRTLVLVLPADAWDRLVADAEAAERDPYQHARWLILHGLSEADEEAAS